MHDQKDFDTKPPKSMSIGFHPHCFFHEASTSSVTVTEFIQGGGDLKEMTAAQIAHLYAHMKGEFDKLDAAKKELSKFIELVKCVALPAAFDKEKIKTFTLENGTRVTKSDRTFVKQIGEQADVFSWLRENGYPDVVKESANSSSLAAIAKEVLGNTRPVLNDDGKVIRLEAIDPDVPVDMPDDLFQVTIAPTTSVVKGKK